MYFIQKRPGSRVLQQRLREIRENIETDKGEGGDYSVALSKQQKPGGSVILVGCRHAFENNIILAEEKRFPFCMSISISNMQIQNPGREHLSNCQSITSKRSPNFSQK
jgi:hypothetical protein